MKRLKIMCLLALAAMALMVSAGAATASVGLSGGLAIGFIAISASGIGTAVSRIGKTSHNDHRATCTSHANNTGTVTNTVATTVDTNETVDPQPTADLNEQLSNPSYERVTPTITPVMAC